MKSMSLKFGALALAFAASAAFAGELDGQQQLPKGLPQGVVVRVDNKTGNEEVFKMDSKSIANDAQAKAVADSIKASDSLSAVPDTELNRDSSQEAWVSWRHPHYPRGGYGYGRGYGYSYPRYGYGGGYGYGYGGFPGYYSTYGYYYAGNTFYYNPCYPVQTFGGSTYLYFGFNYGY